MEYRLLGPFRLVLAGGQERARAARERDLPALLALHAGTTLSRERLIEALWGTDLPANPGNALQQRVFHARRALAEDGERLVTVAGGHRLEVAPSRVDAARPSPSGAETPCRTWRRPGPRSRPSCSRSTGSARSRTASRPSWPWDGTGRWSPTPRCWPDVTTPIQRRDRWSGPRHCRPPPAASWDGAPSSSGAPSSRGSTIREFGQQQLAASGLEPKVRAAHAAAVDRAVAELAASLADGPDRRTRAQGFLAAHRVLSGDLAGTVELIRRKGAVGDPARAGELLGAAHRRREQMGAPGPLLNGEHAAAVRQQVRDALGSVRLTAGMEAGRAVDVTTLVSPPRQGLGSGPS